MFVLVVVVFGGTVRRSFGNWANSAFSVVDDGTNEGTVRPTSAAVSGSPASLVEWNTLGVQGRDFVAGATTAAELAAFHGDDVAVEGPVRVYVGLRSGELVELAPGDGKKRASSPLDAPPAGAPTIIGEKMLVCAGGNVMAFEVPEEAE